MIHRFRVVRCPKCDFMTETRRTDGSFILYDTPYRVCSHCGATYFDPGYHEAGIDVFNDNGNQISFWGVIGLLMFNGAAVEYITSGLIKAPGRWFYFILLLTLALILDYRFIATVWNRIHAEEYHQEQIDLIEGRDGEMSDELAESMERLSDRKYLEALRSHGVDVPEYFYKRVGSREGTFVEPEGVLEVKEVSQHQW